MTSAVLSSSCTPASVSNLERSRLWVEAVMKADERMRRQPAVPHTMGSRLEAPQQQHQLGSLRLPQFCAR